ncbi:hypothetical protein B0A48_14521 [Cryoendolithus antarcticus]|uniref:Uncharacterized protein n=1 Tax=Cryoendolithus antarcticus TaxID=1507870 RepID=A0A1V8SLK0_9PEZI|nr:hypothetical protein B0A48_14521 [Cryoendolithus antarcticus]
MPAAPHQSIAAKVWTIGELQSQVIQCVADQEKAIIVKDKIMDYRYPFKSSSNLRKRATGESKIQAELLLMQRFVDTENVRQLKKYTWCLGTWAIVTSLSGLWVDYTCTQGAEYATAHEQRRRHVHWSVHEALEIFEFELWKDGQLFDENIPDSWEDWKEK